MPDLMHLLQGHDLGRVLGCGAHLAGLRRLAVGPFRVEEALTLEALAERSREELASRAFIEFVHPDDRVATNTATAPSVFCSGRSIRTGC